MCFKSKSPSPPAAAPPPPEDNAFAPEINATSASERYLTSSNQLGRNSLRIDPISGAAGGEVGTGLTIPS